MVDNNEYLAHYGIKGMKWGVRRKYRNFSGSYTKAGVKRFDASMTNYEKKRQEYLDTKSSNADSYTKKYAKSKMKEAKRNVVKDYKHLKLDKLGDKGKERYARGQRIIGMSKFTTTLAKIGSLSITGAATLAAKGQKEYAKALLYIGGASTAISSVKAVKDFHDSRELRAYYGHTSKY